MVKLLPTCVKALGYVVLLLYWRPSPLLQGPPSQTVVFYFVHVYTYIDWGYYLGIYSFQYPCTILAIKEFFWILTLYIPHLEYFWIKPNFYYFAQFSSYCWQDKYLFLKLWTTESLKKRLNFKKDCFGVLNLVICWKKLSFDDVWAILWPFF